MRGYEGWSFQDRSFATALGLSILWHLFWFLSLTIVVIPDKKPVKVKPKIISLGPVLNDKIFRALVENRPEFSKTFYRRLSDFTSPVEIQTKTAERYAPGSVVSLPFGKRSWDQIRRLISGAKVSPEHEFVSKIKIDYVTDTLGIEGEVKGRPLLSRPEKPAFPEGMDVALKNSDVVIGFSVDVSGAVSETQVVSSSGNPESDLVWMRYLRRWQFAPLSSDKASLIQKGKITFRFAVDGE